MPLIVTPRELDRRAEFYHQLSSLLRAGVPVIQALDVLQRSPPSRRFRTAIARILEPLNQGATLTEAIASLGHWLPGFDVALIGAGENSGRLDLCLKLLGDYYQERARLAREVLSNLIYPAAVFHLAVLIFPTSLLAGLVLQGNAAGFLANKVAILIPLYAAIGILIYGLQSRRSERWRGLIERFASVVPVVGSTQRALALSRLSAALESLLAAGVSIIEAWDLAAAASGSVRLKETVVRWRTGFAAGETPAEKLRESKAFPDLFSSLYASGEISGQLEQTLQRLRDYYYEAGSHQLRMLAQWVPRFIYLAVVLFVAVKVFGFYTSYFQAIGQAGGF